MALENPIELKIEGVAPSGTWNGGDLYLPIEKESDLHIGYTQVITNKLGNDANVDIFTFLTTWRLFDSQNGGLSGGAWQKYFARDSMKYYETYFAPGGYAPLAWTLDGDYPLMPGAGFIDQTSANYSFAGFEIFREKRLAIDTRYFRVWRAKADTWEYYAGAGNGWTETVLSGSLTNATNATPIVITSNNHGLLTGDIITITGVNGNTAANNTSTTPTWTITKHSANTFSLDTSVGSGAYTGGGTWKADGAGLRFEPTEIAAIPMSGTNYILVGQDGMPARRCSDTHTASPTWTNFPDHGGSATEAQHFALVGEDLYYSKGANVYNHSTGAAVKVGDSNTNVNKLLWFKNYVLIAKPEGVWAYLPDTSELQRVATFTDKDENNGRVMLMHNGNAYWNAGQGWHKWDGYNDPTQEIGRFDGDTYQVAYAGKVRAACSDGFNLYLIYRVQATNSFYNDFIVIQGGKTLGYHPVFVASSDTADPEGYVGAILFESNMLHFALGTEDPTPSGYLMTDGLVPLCRDANPYNWSVGVITSWFNAEREAIDKWFMHNIVSTVDFGDGIQGKLQLSYQKWGDDSWTDYPTDLYGTNDNAIMTPDADTNGSGFTYQAGIVTTKIRWRLMLLNAFPVEDPDAATKLFYVKSFHAVGMPYYTPAFQATARVMLWAEDIKHRANGRTYKRDTVYAGLKALQAQAAPVTVTFPDGDSKLMTVTPSAQGIPLVNVDSNKGNYTVQYWTLEFREMQ